jgi:hypothetical protein
METNAEMPIRFEAEVDTKIHRSRSDPTHANDKNNAPSYERRALHDKRRKWKSKK